jgi:hypothetical protein
MNTMRCESSWRNFRALARWDISVNDKAIQNIYRLKIISALHQDKITERNHFEVFWDVTTFG